MEAYVFVIFGGDRYIPGVLSSAYSVKMTGTTRQIICMVTHDVSQEGVEIIKTYVDKVIKIDYITSKSTMKTEGQLKKYTNIDNYFTKYRCLGLKGYRKIIFLDAASIVVKNIDHLFNRKNPSAVFFMSKDEKGKKILTTKDIERRFDLRNKDIHMFRQPNGSLLVIEPSPRLLKKYIRMLTTQHDKLYKMYRRFSSGPDEISMCYFISLYKDGPRLPWSIINRCYYYRYNKYKSEGGPWPSPCPKKEIHIINVSGFKKVWEYGPYSKILGKNADIHVIYFWHRIYKQILEDNPDMKHHPGVRWVEDFPPNYPYKSLIRHMID